MNAQNSNSENSHSYYRKDYSKLEKIFNAAVERRNQKKIIYYASDRLFSDDSKKQIVRETYKTKAWATPVSTEDIQTEIISLAKNNKIIPVSPVILNDESSLISFLEISSNIDDNNLDSQSAYDLYQKAKEALQTDENPVQEELSANIKEKSSESFKGAGKNSANNSLLERYYKIKDTFIKAAQAPYESKNREALDKLISNEQNNKSEIIDISSDYAVEANDLNSTEPEEINTSETNTQNIKSEDFEKQEILLENSETKTETQENSLNLSSESDKAQVSENSLETNTHWSEIVDESQELPKLEDIINTFEEETSDENRVNPDQEIHSDMNLLEQEQNNSSLDDSNLQITEKTNIESEVTDDQQENEPFDHMEEISEPVSNEIDSITIELEEDQNKPDVFDQLNDMLSNQNTDTDVDLRELIASIQEDDSYLETSNQVSEDQEMESLSEGENESNDTLIYDYPVEFEEEKYNGEDNFNPESLDFTDDNLEDNYSPITVEETAEVEIIKESLKTKQPKNPKRRIQFDENQNISQSTHQKTSILFDESPGIDNKTYTAHLNEAHKDFMMTRLTLIVAVALLILYSVIMFRNFQGYDYIALILCLIGTFLAWDLKRTPLIYTTIGMMVIVAVCIFYRTQQTGMFDGLSHLVWFLLIPLLVSSSYLYNQYKRQYYALLNQRKSRKKQPQDNNNESKSIFITNDK